MNLSPSGVRPSPVALRLVTQKYCSYFIRSASQWRVFLFMYGLVNDADRSSACIVSNGATISEKINTQIWRTKWLCANCRDCAGTRLAGPESAKKSVWEFGTFWIWNVGSYHLSIMFKWPVKILIVQAWYMCQPCRGSSLSISKAMISHFFLLSMVQSVQSLFCACCQIDIVGSDFFPCIKIVIKIHSLHIYGP